MFLCSVLSVFATVFQMILLTRHVKVGTIERPLSLLDRPIGFHRVGHVTILPTARALSAQLSVLIQLTSLPWQSTSCLTRLRPLIGFTSTRTHLSRPRRCVNAVLLDTVLFTHEGSLFGRILLNNFTGIARSLLLKKRHRNFASHLGLSQTW